MARTRRQVLSGKFPDAPVSPTGARLTSLDLTPYTARGASIPRSDDPDAPSNRRNRRPSSDAGRASAITRTHILYDHWIDRWRQLGWVYEGDGPYSDGTALVPHVREILYARKEDGTTDFDNPTGYKAKYTLRQQLARYDNFAEQIVDLFADYQYAKPPERRIEDEPTVLSRNSLTDWWKDVDGEGTPIDDWLRRYQPMVSVFGHAWVVMDRLAPTFRSFSSSPRGQKTGLSLADLGRPVLRVYPPADVLDWLSPMRRPTAIKVVEPVERTTLFSTQVSTDLRYIIWDRESWELFDARGSLQRSGAHGLGILPAFQWFAKRRTLQPMIGRSLLKDHRIFKDHFNMISEMRELFRSQVFSMLHIQLAEDETVEQARDRLGDHAGTDTLVFTKGGATYIAPPDGPVSAYATELQTLERKMFRLVSLPWETDSSQPEAEGSRQLKTEDLNVKLASLADRAEELDVWISRAYFRAMLGADAGPAAYDTASVQIRHPQKFHVEELAAKAQDLKTVLDLGVGPTATRLLKLSVLPMALPDLTPEDQTAIENELREQEERADEQSALGNERARVEIEQLKAGAAGGGGRPPGTGNLSQ